MKPLIQLVIVVVWTVGGLSMACADPANGRVTENDAYVLLDQLFDLSVTDNERSVQLQRYKQWENLHVKLTRGNKLSNGQMKAYLFMVFVAAEKAKIDSLEEMAKEIVPIFKKQPTVFLGVLRETPFLLPAACDRMNMHFELFGNERDKQKFLEDNQATITNALGGKRSAECLAKLQEP
jgi:hypothetical protein